MTSYADQNKTSPSLGAADCETVATFLGSWGPGVVTSYADQKWTSPCLGAADCETGAAFVDRWDVQRSGVVRASEWDLAVPGGLRTAKLSPLSRAAGGSSGVTPYADQNEASPFLGAATCKAAATFVGSWGYQRHGVIRKPE